MTTLSTALPPTPMANGLGTSQILKFRNFSSSTGLKDNLVDLVMSGSATYPAGGIPLLPTDLGLVNDLEGLLFVGTNNTADGYVYKFDVFNQTLRMFVQGAAATDPLAEVSTGADIFGANATVYARGY